uniref:C-type lectin n=1 Tax=Plectus sambesii TaxID=2011161 RepID=A0A914UUJ7_9BILA
MTFCQQAAPNAQLTSVASAFESYNIAGIVKDTPNTSVCNNIWIGGNDFNQNGQFAWADGTPMIYTNWAAGQPDLSHHCISWPAQENSKWNTEDCGTEDCFICEKYINALTTTPTSPTPPTTTIPLLLNMDLVIAIDGSSSMPTHSFNDIENFIKTLVIPPYFNSIGQGNPGVRIALVVVPGQNGAVIPASDLYTIKSKAGLLDALDSLQNFYDGSSGQKLNTFFNLVSGPDFLSSGYRPGINNHLILYITGTSTVTDGGNAAALAQSIRNNNTYGIITIAYTAQGQPAVNQNVLNSIAGANCVMISNTVDYLIQNGLDFVQTRILSAATTGTYC